MPKSSKALSTTQTRFYPEGPKWLRMSVAYIHTRPLFLALLGSAVALMYVHNLWSQGGGSHPPIPSIMIIEKYILPTVIGTR